MSSFYINPREINFTNVIYGKKGRFNPRTLENDGFSQEEMQRLKKGLVKDGLNHALKVYKREDGKYDLIQGERRLRCLLSLIEADERALKDKSERVLVYNQKTHKCEPAIDVYLTQGVECKFSSYDDEKERIRQAVQENTLHARLSDFELLLQCCNMEENGFSRGEQAEALGVSDAWISQSHSLINGPKCILQAMKDGYLNRTAALTFLDVEERQIAPLLSRVIKQTFAKANEKEALAKEELEKAEEQLRQAESKLKIANYFGNHQSAARATKHIARTSNAVEKAKRKIEDIQNNKKEISVSAINKEAEKIGIDLNRPKTMKVVRQLEEEINEMLKNCDHKNIKKESKVFSVRDVKVIHEVIRWQLGKNCAKHPLEVLDLVS